MQSQMLQAFTLMREFNRNQELSDGQVSENLIRITSETRARWCGACFRLGCAVAPAAEPFFFALLCDEKNHATTDRSAERGSCYRGAFCRNEEGTSSGVNLFLIHC